MKRERRNAEIKKDEAGIWSGYLDGKRVSTFTGHSQATAEEIAQAWLENNRDQTASERASERCRTSAAERAIDENEDLWPGDDR